MCQYVKVLLLSFPFEGQKHGQLYTYPAKRWKMKQRAYQMREAAQLARAKDSAENGDAGRCFLLLLCTYFGERRKKLVVALIK